MKIGAYVAQVSLPATPSPPPPPKSWSDYGIFVLAAFWLGEKAWKQWVKSHDRGAKMTQDLVEDSSTIVNKMVDKLAGWQEANLQQQNQLQERYLMEMSSSQKTILLDLKELQGKTRDDLHEMKEAVVSMSRNVQKDIQSAFVNQANMYVEHGRLLQRLISLCETMHARMDDQKELITQLFDHRKGRENRKPESEV